MPVIAFEGLSGVGKTAVAEAVAKAAGGIAVTSVFDARRLGRSWQKQRQIVDRGRDADARYEYYKALNRTQMRWARRASEKLPAVALNASIYGTVATHRVLGSLAAYSHRFQAPESNAVLLPDIAFYLDLPEDERQKRLRGRQPSVRFANRWDELLDQHQGELRDIYARFELVRLDAALEVPELVDIVRERVQV